MPDTKLKRTHCPNCKKGLLVQPDKVGRRLRCPACQHSFSLAEGVGATATSAASAPMKRDAEAFDPGWLDADNANEVTIRHGASNQRKRAKLAAHFPRKLDKVFQASLLALQSSNCQVSIIDKATSRIVFMWPADNEHELLLFGAADRGTNVHITSESLDSEGRFEQRYKTIVQEIGKYVLLEGDESQEQTRKSDPPEPPKNLPSRDLITGKMYCTACGTVISDKAVICPQCGCATANFNQQSSTGDEIGRGLIAASYALGFLMPIVGCIMAIYLLVKGKVVHALGVGVLSLVMFGFWAEVLA